MRSSKSEKESSKTKQLRKSLSLSTTRPSSSSFAPELLSSASSSSLVRAPSQSVTSIGSAVSSEGSGEVQKQKKKKGLVSKILSGTSKRLKGLGRKKTSGKSDSSAGTGSDDFEPSRSVTMSRTFINAEGEEEPSVTLFLKSPKHIDSGVDAKIKTDEKDDEESSQSGAKPAAISPRRSAAKAEKELSKSFNFVGQVPEENLPQVAKHEELARDSSEPKPEEMPESAKKEKEVRFAIAEVTIASTEAQEESEELVITTPRHLELISPTTTLQRPRSESAVKVQVIKERKTLDRDFVINCVALALDHCKVIESTVQAIEHEHDVDAKYRLKRKRTSLLRFVVSKKYEFLTSDSAVGKEEDGTDTVDEVEKSPAEARTFRGFAFGDDDEEEEEPEQELKKEVDDREVDVSNFSKTMLKSWLSQLAPKLQGAIDDEVDSIVDGALKSCEEYSANGGLKPFMEIFQALEKIQKKL